MCLVIHFGLWGEGYSDFIPIWGFFTTHSDKMVMYLVGLGFLFSPLKISSTSPHPPHSASNLYLALSATCMRSPICAYVYVWSLVLSHWYGIAGGRGVHFAGRMRTRIIIKWSSSSPWCWRKEGKALCRYCGGTYIMVHDLIVRSYGMCEIQKIISV